MHNVRSTGEKLSGNKSTADRGDAGMGEEDSRGEVRAENLINQLTDLRQSSLIEEPLYNHIEDTLVLWRCGQIALSGKDKKDLSSRVFSPYPGSASS